MEKEVKIINIRHRTYTLQNKELLTLAKKDKFRYKFLPLVAYNTKTLNKNNTTDAKVKFFNEYVPFTLYELGVPIAILRSYLGDKIKKEDLISAKRAFKTLKNSASQCCERIIADLTCQIVIAECRTIQANQELIFFVEKSASDKMLGRLASLYLNLDRITICFLNYDASDLMTTVMSYQTGKLHFDIHRLMSTEVADFLGPYPGDSEESLIQTYFYRPPETEERGAFRPMRLDVFSQGLLRGGVETKKEMIKDILTPSSGKLFIDNEPTEEESMIKSLVPVGFNDLQKMLDLEGSRVSEILQK